MSASKGLSEEGLIQWIKSKLQGAVSGDEIGIGDDAAVLSADSIERSVITTDLLVEGVHFRRDWISAKDLGYKSLAVNLSDIAAMGARPETAFLSLALPCHLSLDWMQDWVRGFQMLAQEHGVRVMGGDTTASTGPVVMNVVLLGKARPEKIKTRGGAAGGDWLYVSGPLGDARAGWMLLEKEGPAPKENAELIERHFRPKPYVAEGQWLGGRAEVSAMMDLSDGLAKDLGRLAQASNVGFAIRTEDLPVSKELLKFAQNRDFQASEIAWAGGEDYILLFAVRATDPSAFEDEYLRAFGSRPARIGQLKDRAFGTKLTQEGREFQSRLTPFEHF